MLVKSFLWKLCQLRRFHSDVCEKKMTYDAELRLLDESVFPNLDFIGWYAVGCDAPVSADWNAYKEISALHESLLLLKLDSTPSTTGSKVSCFLKNHA